MDLLADLWPPKETTMTESTRGHPAATESESQARSSAAPLGLVRLGEHWGLVLAYGVITVVLGLVLVIWPGRTLVVLAVFLAIQLILNGVFQLVSAFSAHTVDGGVRALTGLLGAVSVLVGLLCLRSPLQTVVTIGLLIGAWWAASGIIDIFTALLGDGERRVWRSLMGVLSLVAGAFLLVNPKLSLATMVVVVAVWLFAYGALAILAGLQMRKLHTSTATTTGGAR